MSLVRPHQIVSGIFFAVWNGVDQELCKPGVPIRQTLPEHGQHIVCDERGLILSLCGFLQNEFVQRQFSNSSLELSVLTLQILQPAGL